MLLARRKHQDLWMSSREGRCVLVRSCAGKIGSQHFHCVCGATVCNSSAQMPSVCRVQSVCLSVTVDDKW